MENEIYQILKKHKLPLKKREGVLTDLLLLFSVSGSALLVHGIDGRVYKPNSIDEWDNSGNVEKGDVMYKVELIKRY